MGQVEFLFQDHNLYNLSAGVLDNMTHVSDSKPCELREVFTTINALRGSAIEKTEGHNLKNLYRGPLVGAPCKISKLYVACRPCCFWQEDFPTHNSLQNMWLLGWGQF